MQPVWSRNTDCVTPIPNPRRCCLLMTGTRSSCTGQPTARPRRSPGSHVKTPRGSRNDRGVEIAFRRRTGGQRRRPGGTTTARSRTEALRRQSAWDVVHEDFEHEVTRGLLRWMGFATFQPPTRTGTGALPVSITNGWVELAWVTPIWGSGGAAGGPRRARRGSRWSRPRRFGRLAHPRRPARPRGRDAGRPALLRSHRGRVVRPPHHPARHARGRAPGT